MQLQSINGQGLISKNSKKCIARALFLCVHGEGIQKLTEKILAKLLANILQMIVALYTSSK